jgi:hypothetical protein
MSISAIDVGKSLRSLVRNWSAPALIAVARWIASAPRSPKPTRTWPGVAPGADLSDEVVGPSLRDLDRARTPVPCLLEQLADAVSAHVHV